MTGNVLSTLNKELLNVFRLPSFHILSILILAIITSNYLDYNYIINNYWLFSIFTIPIIALIFFYNRNYSILKISSMILLFLSLCLLFLPKNLDSQYHIKNYLVFKDNIEFISYKITSYPSIDISNGNQVFIYNADVIEISKDKLSSIKTSGKALIRYVGEDLKLTKGDIIVIDIFPDYSPEMFHNRGRLEIISLSMDLFITIDDIIRIDYESNFIDRWITIVRKRIGGFFDKNLSNKISSISKAITIGDKSNIDYDTIKLFSSTSSSHLLAISGLHITIILTLIFYILSHIKLDRRIKIIILFPILLFIALLTGSRIPVIRAIIIVIIGLMAYLFLERKKNYFNILFISAIVILILQPNSLFDISFQLSFLAVFGILFFSIPFIFELEKWFNINRKSLIYKVVIKFILYPPLISIFIHIITYPIVIYHFNSFNILGFISNLFVVFIFICFLYSIIICLLFSFLPTLLLEYIFYSIEFFGRLLLTILSFLQKISVNITIDSDYRILAIILWSICFIFLILVFIRYTNSNSIKKF